jgi:hypothetical protein
MSGPSAEWCLGTRLLRELEHTTSFAQTEVRFEASTLMDSTRSHCADVLEVSAL